MGEPTIWMEKMGAKSKLELIDEILRLRAEREKIVEATIVFCEKLRRSAQDERERPFSGYPGGLLDGLELVIKHCHSLLSQVSP